MKIDQSTHVLLKIYCKIDYAFVKFKLNSPKYAITFKFLFTMRQEYVVTHKIQKKKLHKTEKRTSIRKNNITKIYTNAKKNTNTFVNTPS